jgi:hypothetical protein
LGTASANYNFIRAAQFVSNTSTLQINSASGTGVIQLKTAGNTVMQLNTNQNVLIGVGTDNNVDKVQIGGNVSATGYINSTGLIQGVGTIKTSAYTTTATDQIIPTNSTSANFNLTLLSTATAGQTYTIDNSVATANAVTLVGNINGATNFTLNATKTITLYKTATGTNTWRIIFNN